MSKTTLRGPWPGKKSGPKYKITTRKYAPADRHATVRGQTIYQEPISKLLEGKPGAVCIEFDEAPAGKALVHALARYLRQQGNATLRPSLQKIGEGAAVWVVEKE